MVKDKLNLRTHPSKIKSPQTVLMISWSSEPVAQLFSTSCCFSPGCWIGCMSSEMVRFSVSRVKIAIQADYDQRHAKAVGEVFKREKPVNSCGCLRVLSSHPKALSGFHRSNEEEIALSMDSQASVVRGLQHARKGHASGNYVKITISTEMPGISGSCMEV